HNDYSPNGDSIYVVSIPCAATEGTAVLNANGTITYTPGANADPQHPDTFCYKICDYVHPTLCDTAVVIVYIRDFTFTATNDTEYICSRDTIHIPVTANDIDAHGHSQIVMTGVSNPIPNGLGDITAFGNGLITFISNGTPGTVNFSYYICDSSIVRRCDTANVLIHIANCPHPIIDTIYDTTFVNTPDTICVGGYVHTVSGQWHLSTVCPPQNGVVIINDSCFTYVPNTGFFGNDTFCYVICDSLGCTTSEVIITVLDTLIKAVPEACNLDSTIMNTPLTIDELANDIIPHATDTVVTVQTSPEHGAAVVNPDNTITYTPAKDFTGSEQFTYMVCAVTGRFRFCDTAEICVTVVDTVHHCFIPNAFSPNGDGVNDLFVIPCNDESPKATLRMFDRWGVEIWRSNGHYNNDWDGRNQGGTLCPDGTYYAIYEYNDGVTKSQEKFVVIKR
ncbi:MAG: hypothetical protein JWO06_479, partial [Bacteroidota bacterium]|nr:hypothetical protein [Bacteroidota bacterium]